ncbi:hypothetical protein PENSPDRAFT_735060 [Peniophora sp. CONT]|nr:hypothetical protein PENSPDRAFT_735060 [Peniophora sp. CONT]
MCAVSIRVVNPHRLPPSVMAHSLDGLFANWYISYVLHEHSALSCIYGREVAVENALRVAQRAWKLSPADTRPAFDVFTLATFTRTRNTNESRCGLPENCTALLSHPLVEYFDAPLYSVDGLGQYIVDARVPTGYRAVPSVLFAPYGGSNPHRCAATQDRISPIPLWFFERDLQGACLGVPVDRACRGDMQLLRGEYEIGFFEKKTTLKIKFDWPNYAPSEKQIRGTKKSPMHTVARLAKLTAGAVRNFMVDPQRTMIDTANPQPWNIGTANGEVSVQDVLLLGVIFVSDGAAMPLLAARIQ